MVISYLRSIMLHKCLVLKHCLRLASPNLMRHPLFAIRLILHGILHDLSKLSPSEFFPYMRYFKGDGSNVDEFLNAWNKHQNRNPHHWEYWVIYDKGTTLVLEIPSIYVYEMVADWLAFSEQYKIEEKPYDYCMRLYKEGRLLIKDIGFVGRVICNGHLDLLENISNQEYI